MIDVFHMMATCYQQQKQSQRALHCYQTMLQYAWYDKNIEAETLCFELLSLAYFNLSDLSNSKYYNDRQLKQQLEPENSRTKELALKEIG